ncbi:MAG: porin, partial [Steroidobacteraceae bacterium]
MRGTSMIGVRGGAHVLLILWWTVTAALACSARAYGADSDDSDTAALRRELQQEKERIQVLEQRLEADEAAQRAAASTPPAAPIPASTLQGNFGAQGFTLQTADGDNQIHLRGNLSVDDRDFTDAHTPTTADTWLIRKLRPTLEGTLGGIYDFRFMPDFGLGKTIIQDAWADARVQAWLVFTFGKFKVPVGLERLQLEQFARFIEPALTADLL